MGNPQKSGRVAEEKHSDTEAKSQKTSSSNAIGNTASFEPEKADWHAPVSARDTAGYVHDMAIELRGLAQAAKLSFLAYLLDLVIEESGVQKRGRL